MGWIDFSNLQASTYTEITYEILSTLNSTFRASNPTHIRSIYFRCLGEDRHMSMNEFNEIFGFPTDGITWEVPDFRPDRAWRQLTGQELYASSRSKASFLQNPALKYIHRVMAMSLFGRGESTGAVTKVDLLFLWAMHNNIKINTGVWLLKQLLHVARSPVGKICCGGILTLIAMSFGFIPMNGYFNVVEGSNLVDIDTLINMKMCRHTGGGNFILLDDEGHAMQRDEHEEEQIPQEDAFWNDMFEQEHQPPPEYTGQHDHEAGPSSSTNDFSMMQLVQHMEQMEVRMGERMTSMESRIGERMDRIDTRLTRSEEMQSQILNLLQQRHDPANQNK